MTWIQWIEESAAGILFGLCWAWFWIMGRIYKQEVYYGEHCPKWMRVVAGTIFPGGRPTRFLYTFPKMIAIVGFAGSMFIDQYFKIIPHYSMNVTSIVIAQTSFPLFMIIASAIPILIAERKIKKTEIL